jgi:transcriptional regulator with XRE-family HTH domain
VAHNKENSMSKYPTLVCLGATIRQTRQQQGLTVAELATRTGVEIPHIHEVEAGWYDPTFALLSALADGLDVRLSALVSEDQAA